MFDNARPQDIIKFLERIDSTVLVGNTPIDAWRQFLRKNGGTGNTLNEQETNWLNTRTGAPGETGSDKSDAYGTKKGFSGSRADKIHAYLLGSATQ